MNYDDEIPIEKLKTLIESKCQASKSLLMMCCGDINYIEWVSKIYFFYVKKQWIYQYISVELTPWILKA